MERKGIEEKPDPYGGIGGKKKTEIFHSLFSLYY
jgi:hypothetical protein